MSHDIRYAVILYFAVNEPVGILRSGSRTVYFPMSA